MRAGTKRSSRAAQGIVLIITARCALEVRVFSQQQQQYGRDELHPSEA